MENGAGTANHQRLVSELLLEFGSRSYVRCWKRIVGVFRDLHSERIVTVGLPGETDIQGIVLPNARGLFIEVKTGSGKLSDKQKKFRDMVLKFGAIYILARSVEQARQDFDSQYYSASKQ